MNHTQRYLLLSNMYPSPEQPVHGVFVRNMERELVARGANIDHVVIKGRPSGLLHKLFAYGRYTLSGTYRLLSGKYDLTYIHFVSLSAIPLFLCRPFYRGKVVFNAHGSDLIPDTRLKSLMLKLMSPIIGRADLLIVPSTYYEQVARAIFPELSIEVSPSGGIDPAIFFPPEESTGSDGVTHIGFVSRIDRGKGWDTLIDAIIKLRETGLYHFKLTMVGSGSQQQLLATKISAAKLEDIVETTAGKPQDALASYYRTFDLFVFPTLLPESLGLVGLEALCCGVPVIASDIGGPASYIQHGVNGWLFSPGDVDQLYRHIIQYLELDDGRKRLHSQQASKTIKHYNKDLVADRLAGALQKVTEN